MVGVRIAEMDSWEDHCKACWKDKDETSEDVSRVFSFFFFFFFFFSFFKYNIFGKSSPIHLFLGTILRLHQHLPLDHGYGNKGHHTPQEDLAFPNGPDVVTAFYRFLGPWVLFEIRSLYLGILSM